MYKSLSIGLLALSLGSTSNAYEASRNLPDVEIHLENLPSVEKKVKKIEHKKDHACEEDSKKSTHDQKKTKEVKPAPITIAPIEANPAPLKQTIVDLSNIKQEPVIADKVTPIVDNIVTPPISNPVTSSLIIVLDYKKSEITLSAENIAKLASLKSIIKTDKNKIINVVGYSSDNNTKDLNITGNQALQRVVEVRKYLISQNIDASQIAIHSASNKLPITTEDKVEITIIDSVRN